MRWKGTMWWNPTSFSSKWKSANHQNTNVCIPCVKNTPNHTKSATFFTTVIPCFPIDFWDPLWATSSEWITALCSCVCHQAVPYWFRKSPFLLFSYCTHVFTHKCTHIMVFHAFPPTMRSSTFLFPESDKQWRVFSFSHLPPLFRQIESN